jgi:hypothetical protein
MQRLNNFNLHILSCAKNMKKTFSKDLNMHNHEDIKKSDQNNLIESIHHISACDEQLIKKRKIKQ